MDSAEDSVGVLQPQDPESPEPEAQGAHSLLRSFRVLEVMAVESRGLGYAELAVLTGIPTPTLRRIANTLASRGYILIEDGEVLNLGPRLIHLGATASMQLNDWSRPYLEKLVERTGVTASVAVLDSDEVVYLGQVLSRHSLGTFAEVGRRVLPHCTAVGKILLGQLPDRRVLETLQRTGLPRFTPRTITETDSFMEQLQVVRRQGYAFDDGEQDIGVRCIAVPVSPAPRILAVSLSAPESRMSISDALGFLSALESTARELSTSLAWQKVIDTRY